MLRLDFNLVFTILNILIWYVLIRKFLFKPINNIITKREEALNARYDEVKQLQAEAKAEKDKSVQYQNQIESEKAKVCLLYTSTKMLVGVDEQVLRQYGVYSRECAQAMAKTIQEKLHTDISIGVTGTTGNVDPNNADSVQGKMFFCIRIQNMPYTYEVNTEVTGRSRHEIKQFYADQIFEKLSDLIKNV